MNKDKLLEETIEFLSEHTQVFNDFLKKYDYSLNAHGEIISKDEYLNDNKINEELNTFESYLNEGYKIKRNNEVFTLTSRELSDIRMYEDMTFGHNSIEFVIANELEDFSFAEKYLTNPNVCFDIKERYDNIVYSGEIEIETTIDIFNSLRNMELKNKGGEINV